MRNKNELFQCTLKICMVKFVLFELSAQDMVFSLFNFRLVKL